MGRTATDGLGAYEDEVRALGDEVVALRDRATGLFLRGLDVQMDAAGSGDDVRAYGVAEAVRRLHTALCLAADVIGDV